MCENARKIKKGSKYELNFNRSGLWEKKGTRV